jgi:hypothetical protein
MKIHTLAHILQSYFDHFLLDYLGRHLILSTFMNKAPYISCRDSIFLSFRNASIALFIIYGIGMPAVLYLLSNLPCFCFSPSFQLMATFFPSPGIPLFYGFILWKYVRPLKTKQQEDTYKVLHWFGFFYNSYSDDRFYYGMTWSYIIIPWWREKLETFVNLFFFRNAPVHP